MQIVANTADELFEAILQVMPEVKQKDVCREIINANLVLLDPTRNTMCECTRKMPIRYAIGELCWYNAAVNTVKSIKPFSSFWEKISDDGKTVNSNYGWCIRHKYGFNQWETAKQLLLNNSESRQAVIHIKEARNLIDSPTKDVNCTIALQFFVRNNKLDMVVTMRSNDIWLGLPYDLFNFTCMQIQMAMELGVEIGTYYHNAGSLHMYTRDANKAYIEKSK